MRRRTPVALATATAGGIAASGPSGRALRAYPDHLGPDHLGSFIADAKADPGKPNDAGHIRDGNPRAPALAGGRRHPAFPAIRGSNIAMAE